MGQHHQAMGHLWDIPSGYGASMGQHHRATGHLWGIPLWGSYRAASLGYVVTPQLGGISPAIRQPHLPPSAMGHLWGVPPSYGVSEASAGHPPSYGAAMEWLWGTLTIGGSAHSAAALPPTPRELSAAVDWLTHLPKPRSLLLTLSVHASNPSSQLHYLNPSHALLDCQALLQTTTPPTSPAPLSRIPTPPISRGRASKTKPCPSPPRHSISPAPKPRPLHATRPHTNHTN